MIFILSRKRDYSRIDISVIGKFVSNPQLILEAGAADGVDTMRFATIYQGARIIGLEPVHEQFMYLRDLFADFKNVEILNLALSGSDGTATMYLGRSQGFLGGMGSSSLLPPDKHQTYFPEIEFSDVQEVRTISLENLISDYLEVDLLWLDIQGKELEVLASSQEVFSSKVKVLHLEISKVPLYVGMPSEREIRLFLCNAGFKCVIDRVGAISGNALYINTKFF